ncbi:hypothetical protein [Streptomyces sp. NPDC097610]|uniref:hypothetical protein n=1 Tax=Streptomyces sp. NPDC097610 TaxID=3157227 RepID=UPI003330AD89
MRTAGPAGVAVVHGLRDRPAVHGFVPPDFQPVIGPLPAAGAGVTTVLAACTAALVAARRASRIRPIEALGEAALERPDLAKGRLITGCVPDVGAVAVFATGLTRGGDFTTLVTLANSLVLIMVITAAVLGPLMSRTSRLVPAPLLDTSKVTGYLTAANHPAHAGSRGQPVSLSARGVDPTTLGAAMDLQPRAGSLDRLQRNTIALSAVASSEPGRGLGNRVCLQLGDAASLPLTVVAVHERGMSFADVTFDQDLLLAHTTSHLDTSVLVRAVADAHGTAAVAPPQVTGRCPGTAVEDPGVAGEQMRRQEANAGINYLLAGLIIESGWASPSSSSSPRRSP